MESTRFLGVMLDSNLNFKSHISHIRKKVSKGLYILGRARKFFDSTTIKDLYYAFVHPYFSYCNEVWGNTYETYYDCLVKLQKRAIRIIAGVSSRAHTAELFKIYNIIPIDDQKLYHYNICMFLYKLQNNLLPPGIRSYYSTNNQIHQHDTRHSDKLHVSNFNSGLSKRSLHHQSAMLYRKYPNLQTHLPITSYKYHTKIMLLCDDSLFVYY